MEVLRTPEERFANLAGFGYEPRYVEVEGLRIAYVDEGSPTAAPVLLLHGEPTWSYLYRSMIPILVEAGHRVVAIDLVGFGRSDKPADGAEYTYERHVRWTAGAVDAIGLRDITLFGQDWGGLIGLRILAEDPDRFARAVMSNTFLPTGDREPSEAFLAWRRYALESPRFHVGGIVKGGTVQGIDADAIAAYDAPFPDDRYLVAARRFPALVPITPDDPAAEANRAAWRVLAAWEKPFLTAFSDSDPITRGGDRVFQRAVPGAAGQPHTTIEGAGHFIQEDRGPELARVMVDWLAGA